MDCRGLHESFSRVRGARGADFRVRGAASYDSAGRGHTPGRRLHGAHSGRSPGRRGSCLFRVPSCSFARSHRAHGHDSLAGRMVSRTLARDSGRDHLRSPGTGPVLRRLHDPIRADLASDERHRERRFPVTVALAPRTVSRRGSRIGAVRAVGRGPSFGSLA